MWTSGDGPHAHTEMTISRPRATVSVVAATVVLHAVLMGIYLSKFEYDISAFVGASHSAVGQPPLEHVTASIGPGGYDGMFYYAIARNPFVPQRLGIDHPTRRHARILYPILSWLASAGGHPVALLWVMPALNLLLIGGLAWLGSWTAQQYGMSAVWGFVLPLAVNAGIPALLDLTDNVSTLLVFALLVAWLRHASSWLLMLLALGAVLAREQNVLIVAILLAAAVGSRRRAAASALAMTLGVWLAWAAVLQAAYGVSVFEGSRHVRGVPFAGLAYGWSHLGGVRDSTRLAIINGLSLGHMAVLMVVAIPAVLFYSNRLVGAVLVLSLVLAVIGTNVIWNDLIEYRRVLVWLPLGIWLSGLESRQAWLLWSLTPAGLFSLAAALRYA